MPRGEIASKKCCYVFYGGRIRRKAGEEHDGKPLWRGSWDGGCPHAIWVNAAGKRFADESFYKDYLPKTRSWDGVNQTQPNFPPYLIFDSQFREKYSLGTFLPGQDIPETVAQRAPTLPDLASRLGVDEMEYIVNDCGAKAYITSRAKADLAAALLDKMPDVHTRAP